MISTASSPFMAKVNLKSEELDFIDEEFKSICQGKPGPRYTIGDLKTWLGALQTEIESMRQPLRSWPDENDSWLLLLSKCNKLKREIGRIVSCQQHTETSRNSPVEAYLTHTSTSGTPALTSTEFKIHVTQILHTHEIEASSSIQDKAKDKLEERITRMQRNVGDIQQELLSIKGTMEEFRLQICDVEQAVSHIDSKIEKVKVILNEAAKEDE